MDVFAHRFLRYYHGPVILYTEVFKWGLFNRASGSVCQVHPIIFTHA